jgi:hypothetical protein
MQRARSLLVVSSSARLVSFKYAFLCMHAHVHMSTYAHVRVQVSAPKHSLQEQCSAPNAYVARAIQSAQAAYIYIFTLRYEGSHAVVIANHAPLCSSSIHTDSHFAYILMHISHTYSTHIPTHDIHAGDKHDIQHNGSVCPESARSRSRVPGARARSTGTYPSTSCPRT